MLDNEVCDELGKPSVITTYRGSHLQYEAVCKIEKLSTLINNDVLKTQFLRTKWKIQWPFFRTGTPSNSTRRWRALSTRQAANSHICTLLNMLSQQRTVVHTIYMIA